MSSAVEEVRSGTHTVQISRDVINAVGPDTMKFLHSQLSQDVLALAVGDSTWAFLLQPTGKLVGLMHLTRTADDAVVLITDSGHGEAVLEALARFKIRTKCELTLTADQPFVVRWTGRLPEYVSAEADHDENAAEDIRIVAGFPKWGSELSDTTIPNATGLVGSAVSFTKGCYTGQELVERIDSRGGNVPQRLVHVCFPSGTAAHGDLTATDGAEVTVGVVTSCAGAALHDVTFALAYVKRDVVVGTMVATADGVLGEVRDLS
jgi:tRNA-modifying protein YgfZ